MRLNGCWCHSSGAYPLFFDGAGEELEKELEGVPDLLESLLELQEGRAAPPRTADHAAADPISGRRGERGDRLGGDGCGRSEGRGRHGRGENPDPNPGKWLAGRESWEGTLARGGSRGGGHRGGRDSSGGMDPSPGRWLGGMDDALWGEVHESPSLAHGADADGDGAALRLGSSANPSQLRWGMTAKARSRRVQRSSRELWPSRLAPLSPAILPEAASITLNPGATGRAYGQWDKPALLPPARGECGGDRAEGPFVPGSGLRGDGRAPKQGGHNGAAAAAPRPALLEWKRSQVRLWMLLVVYVQNRRDNAASAVYALTIALLTPKAPCLLVTMTTSAPSYKTYLLCTHMKPHRMGILTMQNLRSFEICILGDNNVTGIAW